MTSCLATVEWDRGDAPFVDGRYGRAHAWRFDGPRSPGAAELRELHDRAHHECFIASSVKTAVVVEPAAG